MTGSFLCIGHVPEDTSRPDDILKCIKPFNPIYAQRQSLDKSAVYILTS